MELLKPEIGIIYRDNKQLPTYLKLIKRNKNINIIKQPREENRL